MTTLSRLIRLISAAAIVYVVIVAGASTAQADCYSDQQRIMDRLQSTTAAIEGMGHCEMARMIQREYPPVLSFYNNCTIVDPDGIMRAHVRDLLAWADEVEASACADY